MEISEVKKIKNRIKQINQNKAKIINLMPSKDNFSKTNPRKSWISTIFIDIAGYTELCQKWNSKKLAKLIRCFHEGILDIFYNYDIENIDIQGDGIYGILHTPNKNDLNNKKIFDAVLDIQGFLNKFLRPLFNYEFNYKIGIGLQEELMIIVGRKNERKIVYAGGSVNEAKKLMEKGSKTNCIYLSKIFINFNKKFLINKNGEKMYLYNEKLKLYILKSFYTNW